MKNIDFYIKPQEGDSTFPLCACFRHETLSCGKRNDWVRVSLSPVYPNHPPVYDSDECFAVATRFTGDSLDSPCEYPIHVYLARLMKVDVNNSFSLDDIVDLQWGTLHPTLHLVELWDYSYTQYPWFPLKPVPLSLAKQSMRLTWSLVYYGFCHGYMDMGEVQQYCKDEADQGTISTAIIADILSPPSFSAFLSAIECLDHRDENNISQADMEIKWKKIYQSTGMGRDLLLVDNSLVK